MPTSAQIRDDLRKIWDAGVNAVKADRLIHEHVGIQDGCLVVDDLVSIPLREVNRICVVGAGKAAAGMAVGVEQVIGSEMAQQKQLGGWVNVPAGCVGATNWIYLHAARASDRNEPTPEAVRGTEEILRLVQSLDQDDLCLVLISGGGSALLPAPVPGVSLDDKLQVTRLLSESGANIHELNTVRKQLSRVKGGGLLRACRSGRLVSLIISDVLGDPLDVIASGPTVPDSSSASEALSILKQFAGKSGREIPEGVRDHLATASQPPDSGAVIPTFHNVVIGNNQVALDACRAAAEAMGFAVTVEPTNPKEPVAEQVGTHLAAQLKSAIASGQPVCWISGGEPVVHLVPHALRGKGGRNQQLVLAALDDLLTGEPIEPSAGWGLLSAGTDGEDGPTDAAGAMLWPDLLRAIQCARLDVESYLKRNDAYSFFGPLGALLRTGPTHTNVCDVRVICIIPSLNP